MCVSPSFAGQPGGLSVLPIPYAAAAAAAAAAYGGWGVYPAPNILQQQQQQQQQAQQNGGPPGTPTANGQPPQVANGTRRPGTPNGSVTPGPPEVAAAANGTAAPTAAAPYVFPAYIDPGSGGLMRPAAVHPGMRLLAPGNPLLVGNGQAATAAGVAPGALPGAAAINPAALNLLQMPPNSLATYTGANNSLAGSPSLSLPSSGGGGRRDSIDRAAAFSPNLDKAKAMLGQAAAAGWPYGALGAIGAAGAGGALTPPPGSLAGGMNLLHTRLHGGGGGANLPGGPGGDRGHHHGGHGGGFGGGRNGAIGGLFGSSNNLFANSNNKHRHNSIDGGGKQVNRSKLLEDFR